MKLIKKVLFLASGLGIGAIPLATTISCASDIKYNYKSFGLSRIDKNFIKNPQEHKNVMSTYFNATDMLAALGYYPDFASLNNGETEGAKTIYPDYLKPMLGDNNVATNLKAGTTINTNKYEIKTGVKITDKQIVERETIATSNISTLLLNEWEKVDEYKFTDIVPALIYTSMADGHARYTDESYIQQGYAPWGLNVFEAFDMQAKGMDGGYTGHNFYNKAQSIEDQLRSNIEKANKAMQTFHNKTLLVLEASVNTGNIEFYGRSPGVYNVLYSSKPTRGLGFALPKLSKQDKDNLQVNGFSFKSLDQKTFLRTFKNKADYIMILNDHSKCISDVNYINKNGAQKAASMLKNPSDLSHIKVVDRSNFYDPVWGVIGTNFFVNEITKLFNVKYQPDKIDAFDDDKKLSLLR